MIQSRWVVCAVVAAAVAACGGGAQLPDAPEAAPAEAKTDAPEATEPASVEEVHPTEEAEPAGKKFRAMSPPEKMNHMKKVVTPQMAKVFQEADAEAYGEFGCTTCHGPGAKKGNFTMPNDSLAPLDKAEMDAHPEVTKFMMERVVPEMAKLMGEEPYNPETHEGFGCYACHTKKE